MDANWRTRRPLLVGLLVLAFVFTRLYGLMQYPLFTDEATHIYWAFGNAFEAAFHDGKFLSIVLWRPFLLLPAEPLLTFRLAVVAASLVTLLATLWTGTRLFSFTAGFLGGCVYILLPFALFFNRMAMADDFQLMFGALALAFSVRIALGPPRLADAGALALMLAAGILAKTSSVLFLAIPVLAVLFLTASGERRRAFVTVLPVVVVVGLGTVLLLNLGMASVQGAKVGRFDVEKIADNAGVIASWYWILFTPVGCLLLALAAISRNARIWFLTLVFLLCPVFYLLGASSISSRYVLFSVVPASLLIGRLIANEWSRTRAHRAAAGVMLAVLLASLVPVDWTILSHPQDTPLPALDRWQYAENWPIGFGYGEMATFLRDAIDQTPGQKTLVVPAKFGFPELGLWVLFHDRADVTLSFPPSKQLDTVLPAPNLWLIIDRNLQSDTPPGFSLVWHYKRSPTDEGLEVWHQTGA